MELNFEPTLLADVLENMIKEGDSFIFEASSDNFSEDRFIMEF